jgi:hypothetical protein
VATLDPEADRCDWTGRGHCISRSPGEAIEVIDSGITSRISSDGRFLGFNSLRSLTGYDNTDAAGGQSDLEIYLYDASEDRLVCASCDPSGARPSGGAAIQWPAWPGLTNVFHNFYPQRNVSDHGQVFFETTEALSPADVNGRRDVYEYSEGSLHLISTGAGEAGSHFVDATPSGDNVFFSTAQQLLPRDSDASYDYYDARVGGGFAEPPGPPPPCGAGSCRGGPSEPAAQAPGTASLQGHDDAHPPRSCRGLGRRARTLRRRATRLRRSAGHRGAEGQHTRSAAQFRRKARRLSRRADRLRRRARRCSGKADPVARRAHRLHRRTRRHTNSNRRAAR